ncbi:hypothetical protein D3C77_455470 [compost metagenome]
MLGVRRQAEEHRRLQPSASFLCPRHSDKIVRAFFHAVPGCIVVREGVTEQYFTVNQQVCCRIHLFVRSVQVSRRYKTFVAKLFKFLRPLQERSLVDVEFAVICNQHIFAFGIVERAEHEVVTGIVQSKVLIFSQLRLYFLRQGEEIIPCPAILRRSYTQFFQSCFIVDHTESDRTQRYGKLLAVFFTDWQQARRNFVQFDF